MSVDRSGILRDALAEFIANRIGLAEFIALKNERAWAYVRDRYAGQTADWQMRKVEDVLARCAEAEVMLHELFEGKRLP